MEPDLPEETAALRDRVRAEAASLRAEEPTARRGRFAREGWLMPYLPRPWGRDASPLEQVIIHQEFRDLRRPNLGIAAWAVPSIVRYGTREQQERFLPGTFMRRDRVVPALQRARGGLRPGGTVDEGGTGGGRLVADRPEDLDVPGAVRALGHLPRPHLPRPAQARRHLLLPGGHGLPGVTVKPLKEINGDEIFNEVFLDAVFVPDDLVVGAVNDGWRVARDTLSHERVALGDSWGPGSRHTDMAALIARLPGLRPAQREHAGRLWAEGQAISALGLRVTLSQLSDAQPPGSRSSSGAGAGAPRPASASCSACGTPRRSRSSAGRSHPPTRTGTG